MTETALPRPGAPARLPDADGADTGGRTSVDSQRRVLAIDAVRGLAVVVLLVCVNPGPRHALPHTLHHPEWHGLTFADLFFPLFLFAVGAAMPFSSSASTGRSVARRATILFLIGIALTSAKNTELIVPGVLQHIAIAYVLAWLVLKLPRRAQYAVAAAVVVGAWAAFLAAVGPGVDPWGMRSPTLAHRVNEWFFGGFRTEGLPQSAISVVNVLAGAFATGWLLDHRDDRGRVVRIAAGWALGLAAAALVMTVWVPLNKHLWTPSFAVLSAATSIGFFALALWAIDVRGWRRGAQPLVELGSNAIAVYVLLMAAFAVIAPNRGGVDDAVAAVVPWPAVISWGWAIAWTVLGWAFCHALYRRRIFIRV